MPKSVNEEEKRLKDVVVEFRGLKNVSLLERLFLMGKQQV